MAIKTKYDLVNNLEPLTIILANRGGDKFGQLKINDDSVELTDRLNDVSEISFTVNKYVDEEIVLLWDKIVDFKLIYCKEMDMWFEIKVELDEATETVKTVFGTQLGYAELSQIMLYEMHINEEGDPNWNPDNEEYKSTILYDTEDSSASLLHRLLKDKAPHYSIAHVDYTIANEQRTFSFDGTSICDALQEIAEEIGCLFILGSNSDENGMPQRTISAYDLQQFCNDCNYRGEYTDECPKCGSKNIKVGYGEDTLIFVTSDELATEGIQLVTDTDSVKNCFKLEGGDDLMTATIRNCNPNGTDYIWYFSDAIKEDMPDELVEKIESYDKEYRECYNSETFTIPSDIRGKYNALVEKYKGYKEDLETVSETIIGYPALMNVYYNTIDLALYLESGLMPNIEGLEETDAKKESDILEDEFSSASLSVAISNLNTASLPTVDSAVLAMAKIIVRSTYRVKVKENSSKLSSNKSVWSGKFVITNYSDEEDIAETEEIRVNINSNIQRFVEQKIEKALNKEDTDDYSVSGLFEKEYNVFRKELEKYALNPLVNFREVCQSCIDILVEQGAGKKENALYETLYKPYYNKLKALESEIKLRNSEINIVLVSYDDDGKLINKGIQFYIEEYRNKVQKKLDFQEYLEKEDLWKTFCAYRRDDKYSNSNYISDGLNNAELFKRAQEFIEVAENEIYKSSELQCSISTTLNNLMTIPKFRPLVKSFDLGNWIRVRVDDNIYKLRLLEYSLNYGEVGEIPVEFSEVSKIKNGYTDIQNILSQASSMATSYDSVQKQAKQGDEARGTIRQWLEKGLNSALVQIQSNDDEEITLTKNGLLGRSYNDILGDYSPEQIKLTHNVMAYTDDNWETVKQAIGKHDYMHYDSAQKKFVDRTGFGLSAEFVTAGYISGSQIIGGDIYSDNYNESEQKGSYINLRDGTFNFGGGKITFNGTELTVNPDNGMITETDVGNIATKITSDAIKTAKISANNITTGTLSADVGLTAEKGFIGGWNITKTGLDKTSGNYTVGLQSTATSTDLAFYVKKGTEDIFFVRNNGEMKATAGNIAGWTIGSDRLSKSYDNTGKAVNYGALGTYQVGMGSTYDPNQYAFYVRKRDSRTENGNTTTFDNYLFSVNNQGVLTAKGADIEGSIIANQGSIGGWEIGENINNRDSIYKEISYEDEEGNEHSSEIGMQSGGGATALSFYVKHDNEDMFFIRNNGYLYAKKADIEGKITASEGRIGSWNIGTGTSGNGVDSGALFADNGDYRAWIHTPGYEGTTSKWVYSIQKNGNPIFYADTEGVIFTKGGILFGDVDNGGFHLKTIRVGTCDLKTAEGTYYFDEPVPQGSTVTVFLQSYGNTNSIGRVTQTGYLGFKANVLLGDDATFYYVAYAF